MTHELTLNLEKLGKSYSITNLAVSLTGSLPGADNANQTGCSGLRDARASQDGFHDSTEKERKGAKYALGLSAATFRFGRRPKVDLRRIHDSPL